MPASPPTDPISPVSAPVAAGTTTAALAATTHLPNPNTPSLNAQPIELDSIPTSPEAIKRRETGGSVVSPADGADIEAEFLGGEGAKGSVRMGREKRAAMLASRSKDPGVIVDVPCEPTAEEVQAAKSGDGTVTPGLEGKGGPVLER